MSKSNKIQPFVWGAVAGAIAALLLAPKSGRELRKDIVKSSKTAGSKTAEYGRQAGAAAKTFAGKTATVASCVKEAANRIVTELRVRKDQDEEAGRDAEETKAV